MGDSDSDSETDLDTTIEIINEGITIIIFDLKS